MSSKTIKGTWQSFKSDFMINYQGVKKSASIAYQGKVDKNGMIVALIYSDSNKNGGFEPGEKVLVTVKANAKVAPEISSTKKETGSFIAKLAPAAKPSSIKFYYKGDLVATGSILSPDDFF